MIIFASPDDIAASRASFAVSSHASEGRDIAGSGEVRCFYKNDVVTVSIRLLPLSCLATALSLALMIRCEEKI
jgi:hypothetical protein